MRAITYSRLGPAADVLEMSDVATPDPAPGEVLVRLAYSGVNPSDAKARAGMRPGVTKPPFPRIIPHSDGAGVIEAVGDGVDPARIGRRVWIWNGQWQRAHGTAAEIIALPEAQAVDLPEGVDMTVGATLGIPGLTACHTVLGGGEVKGLRLLVSGGAGAVGHMAVQLARWGGAEVIATASGAGMERARAAGAAHVFDYADPDLAAKIMEATQGRGVDRAVEVEFGRNAALLGEVMAPLGTVAAYGSGGDMAPVLPFGAYLFKALTIDISLIYILPDDARRRAMDRLHAALAEEALVPAIHEIVPLADCARAHDRVMTPGRNGAVLLEIG